MRLLKMPKRLEKKLQDDEKLKFCNYICRHIKFDKRHPLCHTFDVIYCKKYKTERNKGSLCLEYQNARNKN